METLELKYNELKEKWKRIDKIRDQISLCVSMNMSKPKLEVKLKFYDVYTLRVMYSGKEFRAYFHTMSEKFNLPHIKEQMVHHILKWELEEKGIEYPPRLERR